MTINDYNDELINKLIRKDLSEYFVEVHQKFYNNVNIAFMDYFLSIVDNDDQFVVEHEKLYTYGVISDNNNTSGHIKRCLEQYDLKENEDYLLSNVGQQCKKGNIITKKEYKLTPYAFKICLIRAKNSKRYANYYLLLEKVFKYYCKYQRDYSEKILSSKDAKIDELEKKMDNMLKKADHIIIQNESLLDQNENLENKLEVTTEILEETVDKLEETRGKVDKIAEDLNIKPSSPKLHHHFTLLRNKNDNSEFRVIKGQLNHINKTLRKTYSNNYVTVIDKKYNANPIDMFNRLKETIKKEIELEKENIKNNETDYGVRHTKLEELKKSPPIKISYSTIKIDLNKITESELIKKIEDCDLEKFNIVVP
jgi:phage anti-repressor protein